MRSPPSARPAHAPSSRALDGTEPMLALEQVLSAVDLAHLAPAVRAFYREPQRFRVHAELHAGRWSALLLRLFALLSGQCRVLLYTRPGVRLAVSQRVYRDAAGRTHWDRYVEVGARLTTLFTACIEHGPRVVVERFVIWGVGLPVRFKASVDGHALVLESRRFLLGQRVVYRSAPVPGGVETHGELRLAWLGLAARTVFSIREP
jgi:Domain of unknown function (DUF4166)